MFSAPSSVNGSTDSASPDAAAAAGSRKRPPSPRTSCTSCAPSASPPADSHTSPADHRIGKLLACKRPRSDAGPLGVAATAARTGGGGKDGADTPAQMVGVSRSSSDNAEVGSTAPLLDCFVTQTVAVSSPPSAAVETSSTRSVAAAVVSPPPVEIRRPSSIAVEAVKAAAAEANPRVEKQPTIQSNSPNAGAPNIYMTVGGGDSPKSEVHNGEGRTCDVQSSADQLEAELESLTSDLGGWCLTDLRGWRRRRAAAAAAFAAVCSGNTAAGGGGNGMNTGNSTGTCAATSAERVVHEASKSACRPSNASSSHTVPQSEEEFLRQKRKEARRRMLRGMATIGT